MWETLQSAPLNFSFPDKTKFVWQPQGDLLYLDNSFLAFVIYSPLSRILLIFLFKDMKGQKWQGALYGGFGGSENSVEIWRPHQPLAALLRAF